MHSSDENFAIPVFAAGSDRAEQRITVTRTHGVDADAVNAVARHGRGLITCSLSARRSGSLA
jgi:hypothetical protein